MTNTVIVMNSNVTDTQILVSYFGSVENYVKEMPGFSAKLYKAIADANAICTACAA